MYFWPETRLTRLIVFDFDGVIADSETLANAVLSEVVTELGSPMTLESSMHAFIGKRFDDIIAMVSAMTGRSVADCLAVDIERRTIERFRRELKEIAGMRTYLEAFPDVKHCIASSSSPDRLAACLDILGFVDAFGPNVYSASLLARGKPHPDIFLNAAAQSGVAPADAIVIEDSVNGIRAAVHAGMTAIGLLAGSHIRPGDAERLHNAGAHHIAHTYREVDEITRRLLA
jgi:HAD superfamily hydrolase (TIGR01509 family)